MNTRLNNTKDITRWLDEKDIKNYKINDDLSVDVNDNVSLDQYELDFIPVQFRAVIGNFSCTNNYLTSLEGSPEFVGANFYCHSNQLTSLDHSPAHIGKNFNCDSNLLTSLRGCPSKINEMFSCSYNHLTSLQYAPQWVEDRFYCDHNLLTSLEHCPEVIGTFFNCKYNNITSLEFCPKEIKVGGFYCDANPGLGDIQKIEDFEEIYKIHQQIMVKKEKMLLQECVSVNHIKAVKNHSPHKI